MKAEQGVCHKGFETLTGRQAAKEWIFRRDLSRGAGEGRLNDLKLLLCCPKSGHPGCL